jgi:mediator of RNA polymerase II transcription subunit 7
MDMDDDAAELRNPFPSPPSHYARYTSHNLALLALLKQRAPEDPDSNQLEILNDQNDVPDWPLVQLEKPRVDWILEEPDAYYEVFGDRWFVCLNKPSNPMNKLNLKYTGQGKDSFPRRTRRKPTIPSGPCDWLVACLYTGQPSAHLCITDRRPALRSVLRSLLVTYSALTGSLLAPPPVSPEVPPEWQRHVEWINVLSQNLMAAANDLRPVQVIFNYETSLRRR